MIEWLRRPATIQLLRVEALVISVIGIAFFVLAAIVAPALGWESPELIWKAGLIMTAVGAICLVGLMGWVYPVSRKITVETVIGFASLLLGMLSIIAALGNEEKVLGVFWLVMAIVLIPPSMALIMLAAMMKRRQRGDAPAKPKARPEQSYKRFY